MSSTAVFENEKRLLKRHVNKFSDIENTLRILLSPVIKAGESTFILVSLCAHLYDKHHTENCVIYDMLVSHDNAVKDKSSTWFDLCKSKEFDSVNERIADLVYMHEIKEKTA